MDNVRYNISPCSASEARAFIDKIDTSVYSPRGFVAADGKCHYDRYSYFCDDSKVAVVYDVTACVISITGRAEHSEALLKLYAPSQDKTVKRSTVPAQGSFPNMPQRGDKLNAILSSTLPPYDTAGHADRTVYNNAPQPPRSVNDDGRSETRSRSRVFVSPDALKPKSVPQQSFSGLATSRGHEISTDEIYPPQRAKRKVYADDGARAIGDMSHSVIANARGQEISTDEIYPPQIAKKRPQYYNDSTDMQSRSDAEQRKPASEARDNDTGINISLSARKSGLPRRAVISFGDEEDDFKYKSDTKINTRVAIKQDVADSQGVSVEEQPKRKRGRPPKNKQTSTAETGMHAEFSADKQVAPEYKNGYSVKNYPQAALSGVLKRLKSFDRYKVASEGVEFGGTPQEIKAYSVSDTSGQKVILRYAVGKMTLQLQGKRSELFGEVQSQISQDSDYSSALEGYVEAGARSGGDTAPKAKVTDVQNKLKKRLPTAYEYLSEQSRIDFSYGIHDFGQASLMLSDYSVLLVPPFRGLERLVFDLQRSEGIKVKMIGQAYDKNDRGNYILKSGYQQRINSVIYCEVMVSLYTEYFSRRNFFAHSDNTDENVSRAIPDRNVAKHIFDHLLDVVEYNAKKLKEIGYTVKNRT